MTTPTSARSTAHAGPRRPRGARPAAATALTGAALAALLVTGCGAQATDHSAGHGSGHSSDSGTSTSAEGATDHGEADVAFASGMVVHHEGALTMAQDAAQRASTPEVRALAERVLAAQQPEIDQMEGWLAAWGEEGGSHAGHDVAGTSDMAGTSEDDTAALAAASGTDYDRLFLEQMTAHHRDAVEMAQREQAEGTAPEAVALAERIEADQTAEIAEMAGLLQQLGG
jgi:uncharacterized protein (DUF305 family)